MRSVVFTCDSSSGSRTADAQEMITNGEGYVANPSWSPTGQTIAFAWTRGFEPGAYNIFIMDIASKKYNQLTSNSGKNENPYCKDTPQKPADTTENQRSAGILLTYGKFRFLDLGDLTWDVEMQLACPVNKLGTVTLFQATHHGFFNDFSGAPAHVLALKPQLVIVNNGATKGWQNSAWDTVAKIPGLDDVWQVHQAMGPNRDHNVKPDQIANLEATPHEGHWLMASVARDGKITITNERTGFSKSYTTR